MSSDIVQQRKRKRGDIKSTITRFNTFLSTQYTVADIDKIRVKMEHLIEKFKSIYDIHEDLMENDADNEEEHTIVLENIEEEYHSVLAIARKLIRQEEEASNARLLSFASPSTSSSLNPTTTPQINMKLPEISLPTFNGNLENWQSFKDKFESRIGRNSGISKVDKFQYLQSSLTGKAAQTIEALPTTEDNYDVAWELLQNKYDNSRKIILRHWSILHYMPKLVKDTPEAIDQLINTFQQHIRALKSLNQQIDDESSYITHLLLTKINNNTKFQWETTLTDNKMPPYQSLIGFLQKKRKLL